MFSKGYDSYPRSQKRDLGHPAARAGRNMPINILDNVKHCITLTNMRTAKTISITLPPDLLLKAQKTAEREDRTISELFREALRR